MTRETLPKNPSEEAPDVFDMDLARETTQPSDATPAGIRGESANGGGMLAKIGPRHFWGLTFAIAVVCIAWPEEKSRAPSTTSSSVLNTQLRSAAAPSTSKPTDRTGTSIAQSTAPGNPAAAAIGSTLPAVATATPTAAQIVQAQAQQAAALIAAIDDLGARLVLVETRLSAQEKTSAASPQHSENHKNKPQEKRYRSKERTRTSADKAAAPRLAGYSLNTIYASQAWIVRDGHLTLVQQGDIVDEFEVIRIDARDHQVLTSRGIIR